MKKQTDSRSRVPAYLIATAGALILTGCGHQQAATPMPTPARQTPAGVAAVPSAGAPATPPPAQTVSVPVDPVGAFAPYTLAPQLPPKPTTVTHAHRKLRVVHKDSHYYLADNFGHTYPACRDSSGDLVPAYQVGDTGNYEPLRYDPDRDSYYREGYDNDDHCYYRNYVGDAQNQYYRDDEELSYYQYDVETVLPDDERCEIYDSPEYTSHPSHDDAWLLAIPVAVAAIILLQPHQHYDPHLRDRRVTTVQYAPITIYAPTTNIQVVRPAERGPQRGSFGNTAVAVHPIPAGRARFQPGSTGRKFVSAPVAVNTGGGRSGGAMPSIRPTVNPIGSHTPPVNRPTAHQPLINHQPAIPPTSHVPPANHGVASGTHPRSFGHPGARPTAGTNPAGVTHTSGRPAPAVHPAPTATVHPTAPSHPAAPTHTTPVAHPGSRPKPANHPRPATHPAPTAHPMVRPTVRPPVRPTVQPHRPAPKVHPPVRPTVQPNRTAPKVRPPVRPTPHPRTQPQQHAPVQQHTAPRPRTEPHSQPTTAPHPQPASPNRGGHDDKKKDPHGNP